MAADDALIDADANDTGADGARDLLTRFGVELLLVEVDGGRAT